MKKFLLLFSAVLIITSPGLSLAAPPVAAFSADSTFGVSPLIVSFTDLSTGNVDSWAWDFDGDSLVDSFVQNPSFQYLTPGAYTVTLTVSGSEGTDDEIKTDYIIVSNSAEPPLADFIATPTGGVLPLDVQFSDQSTGGITGYYWEFGDGQTSTEKNPDHIYAAAGDFTVKLTVTGPMGLDLMGKVDYIQVITTPPVTGFSAVPTSGAVPLTVAFTDQSSGTVDSWFWDFNDDGTVDSTEQNPLYTYDTSGIYTVALTTTGPGGGVIKKKINYVDVSAGPVADFSATPMSGAAPLEVTFTDLSDGTVDTWAWDFNGDGTNDSTEQNPSFTYNTSDNYTVGLTVTGPVGSAGITRTDYIHVSVNAITADFTAAPATGPSPLDVIFFDQSTGTIDTWAWDFDNDGTIDSTEQNPMVTFNSTGLFTPTLSITGPEGTDTRTRSDYIQVMGPPPVAGFTGSPTSGTVPLDVQFADASSGPVTDYLWEFGDGQTSTEVNPFHTYTIGGDYLVLLTVTGPDGSDVKGMVDYIHVGDLPPSADFTADPTSGETPLAVQFTDLSSGVITDWQWDFDDDGTIDSTEQSPLYTYTNGGIFSVKLTVTGPGGSEIRGKFDYIHIGTAPPVADFTGTPLNGVRPLTVQFTDQSTGTVTNWLWDFGDGQTGTGQNPNHDYHLPGDYTVTLTATGPGGSHIRGKGDYVHVAEAPPVTDFMANGTTVSVDTDIDFTDLSTGTITSWFWDFGDGQSSTEQHPTHSYEASGNYTVRLDISGPGGSDSLEELDFISVSSGPLAEFDATPISGPRPLSVTFMDRSMGTITGYLWDFGDGQTSTEQNPTHQYMAEGDYAIQLTVTGPSGSDLEERSGYIHVGEDQWWARAYGVDGQFANDRAESVAATSDGAYLVAGFAATGSDLWVTKLNTDGTVRWEKAFSSQRGDYGRSVTPTTDGGLVVAGDTYAIGDGYHASAWVVKLNREGNLEWQRIYGDNGMQRAYAIEQTEDGGYIVVGENNPGYLNNVWVLKLDFNGTPAWEKLYSNLTGTEKGQSVQQTADGGYIVAGSSGYDFWLLKLDMVGTVVWQKRYDQNGFNTARSIRQTTDLGYIVTGEANGAVWVLKLNPDGTIAWQKSFNGPGVDIAQAVKQTSDGGFIVAGRTTSFGAGEYDAWLLKLSADGTIDWEKTYGGSYDEGASAVLQTPDNGYVVAGYTESFGDGFRNYPDAWVLRLDANGDIPTCGTIGTSTATVTDTTITSEDTSASIMDTYILPEIVTIADFDTAVLIETQCSCSPLGQADFSADSVAGYRPLSVQFTDQSTGAPASWLWNFGDGSTSTEQNPAHDYTLAGHYTVSLTTDGPDGIDTEIKTDYIDAQHVAGFSGAPDTGAARLTVFFSDESQGPSVADWSWDFGDGKTSTERNPVHKYFDPGFYTVSLTVIDQYGPDTVVKTNYVEVEGYGVPKINKLDPNTCFPKEKIKIKGYNFGETQGTSIVHFGNKTFDSTSPKIKVWKNKKIKVKVPGYKCSRFDTKDYIKIKVWVTVDDTDSNILKLKVMKPATCP